MNRDAQKANFSAAAKNIGHSSVGVLYHFHNRKSRNSAGLRDDEQPRSAPQNHL
jgi:hypothetical protein